MSGQLLLRLLGRFMRLAKGLLPGHAVTCRYCSTW
jgi:hypothetical protein